MGPIDIDKIVADAEIEWSYHEDNHRYPRDFWHARITYGPLKTSWCSYGEQEERKLPESVKISAEMELRDEIRRLAESFPVIESPKLPPIETDPSMPSRQYIPLPGGWEIQTKGTGSSYRLLDTKSGERYSILGAEPEFIRDFITRMALEIHVECSK